MSNHFISLNQAIAMTTLYRVNREAILEPSMKGKDILFISESFSRDAFDYLLGETGASGLRFYLGMNENMQITIIAVATDAQGGDLLPDANANGGNLAVDGNQIAEIAVRCPTNCPTQSALGG